MKIKPILIILYCICLGVVLSGCSQRRQGEPRILVFTKTAGFHHLSIPEGVKAIQKMGKKKGFSVDATSDSNWFTEDSLKKYATVIFLNTTGDVLDMRQQKDFERYIQAGGGYVGIHAASDCEYHWPWYGKLVSAYFKGHPRQQQAKLIIHKDENFPITDSLPNPWIRKDEWYNFRALPRDVHVLVSIDENSYEGGDMEGSHPMVWYHDYDGGRSFYMELGHTNESYTESHFLKLLWAGIDYSIGKNKVLDYSKATTIRKPDEDRFKKQVLAGGLNQPTELTILPDLSMLIAEWEGDIKFYNAADQTIKKVAHLDIGHFNGEFGLLGLQADPQYKKDHWVYVYYSQKGTKSVDRLSRIKFQDGNFDLKTEQVILEVPTKRGICCHTGGSIAFGPKGNLFLSTGDNTTPFDEINPKTGKAYHINLHGFAPLDDRPGFESYDDRRAAGNSNDLRGKVLRIHVNEDGSYSIPTGNLYPEGTPKTRPEIYVQGCRNPYRISIDQHTGFLYWGDVGPDAVYDSMATRGPRGYDEINQARQAGNFGWPYFVGDNYAYHEYNYATGQSGSAFDPNHVVNNSRNNTGLKVLPPAQPAFIWYPYDQSPDFPMLGSGGRTAMAGPVYYVDDYPQKTRYPEYFNDKLFIYEWTRGWIKVVTMNKEGDLQTIERFMPTTTFHHVIDLEVGFDGRLYIIEYGDVWNRKNPNAALSVLTYNGGNRAPIATLTADTIAGALPLTVNFSAKGSSDPDGDQLAYTWNFEKEAKIRTDNPITSHTFSKAGTYSVTVEATDGKGGSGTSSIVYVNAGNSIPQIDLSVSGNATFYFPRTPVHYQVKVNDVEDGTSDQPGFDSSKVLVHALYFKNIENAISSAKENTNGVTRLSSGKRLMESLDCQSCHRITIKSVGPAFKEVALRYKNDGQAIHFLPEKIINGGNGNWGRVAMSAHPDLSVADAGKIVEWILSLSDTASTKSVMPIKGDFVPDKRFKLKHDGAIILSASYTDKGAKGVSPLSGNEKKILRSPVLQAESADATSDRVSKSKILEADVCRIDNGGWVKFADISLIDVKKVQVKYAFAQKSKGKWVVELRLDNPNGKILGTKMIDSPIKPKKFVTADLRLSHDGGDQKHDVYFVFRNQDREGNSKLNINEFRLISDHIR